MGESRVYRGNQRDLFLAIFRRLDPRTLGVCSAVCRECRRRRRRCRCHLSPFPPTMSFSCLTNEFTHENSLGGFAGEWAAMCWHPRLWMWKCHDVCQYRFDGRAGPWDNLPRRMLKCVPWACSPCAVLPALPVLLVGLASLLRAGLVLPCLRATWLISALPVLLIHACAIPSASLADTHRPSRWPSAALTSSCVLHRG